MKRRGVILVLLCGIVGCNARQTSTTTNAVAPVAAVFPNQGEWVSSQDKSLSLRVSTDKATYRIRETVRVQIEVRNKSKEVIRLPSLEDEGFPWITGSKEIKYIGPQVDKTPEPEIVLNPGVSGTREVSISGENWGRLDLPGKYVVHFLYQGPSSGIYQGLESSVGFSVEKEQSSSPLATNPVSVSVAGYFTTNINGRAAVRATIKIDENIVVTVVGIRGDRVRLGIEAPREMPVHRKEVHERIQNGVVPMIGIPGPVPLPLHSLAVTP